MKVTLLVNCIKNYREPLYSALAKNYDLTIIHEGPYYIGDNLFTQYICKRKRIGPFVFNYGYFTKINNPDVIIVMKNIRYFSYLITSIYYKLNGVKLIYWGSWFNDNNLANYIKIQLAKFADINILYSENFKVELIQKGVSNKKCVVANNTLNVPNSQNTSIYGDEILFVGTIEERKGLKKIIESFFIYLVANEYYSNLKFNIVGDGPQKNDLILLVNNLSLSNYIFFNNGSDDHTILIDYYRKAKVFLSPFQSGLSVLQSFAYGVPYITSKIAISGGEKFNVIDEHNGLVLDNNFDLYKLFSLIENNSYDFKLMGNNAYNSYNTVGNFNNFINVFKLSIEKN
jgi:glycosyltransferase involved in cell wall biosynthesis